MKQIGHWTGSADQSGLILSPPLNRPAIAGVENGNAAALELPQSLNPVQRLFFHRLTTCLS